MLGGYGHLDKIDTDCSSRFIESHLRNGSLKALKSCDCGAGIGRVSKTFLLNHFSSVDLIEQSPKFLEQAKKDFRELGLLHRVGKFIAVGLQDFSPEKDRYDLIWIQWTLSHLTDDDLIDFLKRCKGANPTYIGIKENCSPGVCVVDKIDSSITRPDYLWKDLFDRAGLTLVKEAKQTAFPAHLFEVKMYLLK